MRAATIILLAFLASIELARAAEPSTADRAAPRRDGEPAFLAASVAPSEPRIELVPSVRRGHSMTWKTGAIITFTSIGVTLAGAWMTVAGLGPNPDSGYGGNGDLFIAGLVISAIGDGGVFIGGPITWMAGIRGRNE